MAVLNVTPDSFSDGGRYQQRDALKRQISEITLQGADIIDVGGESTRPGAIPVSLDEELARIVPAIELVKQYSDCAVSVDTYKAKVMQEVLALGVEMINDINALQDEGALSIVSQSNALICLMHKQGQPKTMQTQPEYQDVVSEVTHFLTQRVNACRASGIAADRIVLDPGFGFGKHLEHNQALMQNLSRLIAMGYPVLVGVSRKTMIGEILNHAPVSERMIGSVVAAVIAAQKGAAIVRVHDVLETRQALDVLMALN